MGSQNQRQIEKLVQLAFEHPRARRILSLLMRRKEEDPQFKGMYFSEIARELRGSRTTLIQMLTYLLKKQLIHNQIRRITIGSRTRVASLYTPSKELDAIKGFLIQAED